MTQKEEFLEGVDWQKIFYKIQEVSYFPHNEVA